MNPLIQLKKSTPLSVIVLALACFGLVPIPKAFGTDTDGALPNGNNADGVGVLTNLTTGAWNSGFGFEALNHDTIGSLNTATGLRALFNNTEGDANTANGMMALFSNTTGFANVATGAQALVSNLDGSSNAAVGTQALFSNTSGSGNCAFGQWSLAFNTVGDTNSAFGFAALFNNTEGYSNTANGVAALSSNTIGYSNTANGFQALSSNTEGHDNTANGRQALFSNTIGDNNTANGISALFHNTEGIDNVAIGVGALAGNTTGSGNTALGTSAGANLTTGTNNIDISNPGVANETNTIRIGLQGNQTATFIAGISGAVVPGGVTVIVDAGGHLGTVVSSQRFKDEIKPMDKASEVILALKPVTFRYKKELDPNGIPQFGLVAEDVEKVNPDLVARDADGKVNTVRYEAVNAMLLNEFLKEHRKVEEQEATIIQLKSSASKQGAMIANQQKQIEALTAGLQKVSAQVEMNRPAAQTVLNNQ
ncbi:MAG TPA: tail fiber domain-containing protein [Candidatus Binatia bacterium]|jgi:hypothetical protein